MTTPPGKENGDRDKDVEGQTSSVVTSGTRERRVEERVAREKLKEDLLRQYEMGQLKTDTVSSISSEDIKYLLKKLEADIETERQHKPQQIPTIADLRNKTSTSRSTSFLSGRQSANVRLLRQCLLQLISSHNIL